MSGFWKENFDLSSYKFHLGKREGKALKGVQTGPESWSSAMISLLDTTSISPFQRLLVYQRLTGVSSVLRRLSCFFVFHLSAEEKVTATGA